MKTRKLALFIILTLLVTMLAACGKNGDGTKDTEGSESQTETSGTENVNTEGSDTEDSDTESSETDTNVSGDQEIEVITIAKALELCGEPGNITEERYYIRGTVTKMINASYGNMVVTDATGSITVYGTYSADGSLKYSEMSENL